MKFTIESFASGTQDDIEEQSIKEDAASRSLNFLSLGTHTELRRGYAILGNRTTGTGKITGLKTAHKADGTEVLFRSRGQKIESYDSTNDEFDELGSNTLGSAADGEDVAMDELHSESGAQLFISSPNSDIKKVMVANREHIKSLSSTNYKGKIKIAQNRTNLWDRKNSSGIRDETGLYLSYIDARQYTTVTAEAAGTGDGTTRTFSGTVAAISAVRTIFAVTATDGTETFTDDRNGLLVGSAGGTGTINYATGVWSVTFAVAPVNLQAITITYRHETSTSQGVADFSFSGTRTAGQGDVFEQATGGRLQNVLILSHNNTDYQVAIHERATWLLQLTKDDTDAENYIYRLNLGIPYWRAAKETSLGIVLVDTTQNEKPRIRVLRISEGSETRLEPISISNNINLTNYRFDLAEVNESDDFITVACRTSDSTINNRMWLYNKRFSSPETGREVWDVVDYYASVTEKFNRTFVAGDPIQNNVWILFSGFDDDGSLIPNYWEGRLTKLQIDALKRLKRLVLQGLIGSNQSATVSLAVDRGSFVEIGTIDGASQVYVDRTQAVNIGGTGIGIGEIGGGGSGTTANNYVREFTWEDLAIDKFYEIKIRIACTGIGYFNFSKILYNDIRQKTSERTTPLKYRS